MKYLLLSLIIVISASSFAQKLRPPLPPTPAEELRAEICSECFFTNKFNKLQRHNIYPFKNAVKVSLIAFKEFSSIPVKNHKLDDKKVLERIDLDATQADSLSSLLYNVGFTPVKNAMHFIDHGACYEPRNGILFIDAEGKISEYIEICFACQNTRVSSLKVKEGEYCFTKFDLIREFFLNSGIKYGTQPMDTALTYQKIFQDTTIKNAPYYDLKFKLKQKSNNGKSIDRLNETEKALFFACNGGYVYEGGLSEFYLHVSGNYFKETVNALKELHAEKLANAMELSLSEWPDAKVPVDINERRAILLKIANKAATKWHNLVKGLYDTKIVMGGEESTKKENIEDIIYRYAKVHMADLVD